MTEEWYLDSERLRSFVDTVDSAANTHEEIPDLLAALHDPFRDLLVTAALTVRTAVRLARETDADRIE